jgi:hypothetical protein
MLKPPIALLLLALLLLVIVGQNLSPSLSIAFLGTKSIALPLGVWVALAIAAGVLTSQVIALMLQLVSPPRPKKPPKSPKSRSRTAPPPIEPDSQEPWDEKMPDAPPSETSVRRPPPVEEVDNSQYRQPPDRYPETRQWRSDEEEWDNEQEWPTDSNATDSRRYDDVNVPTFEVQQEPTKSYRSGSVYGYSYRRDAEKGVKQEAEAAPQDPLDRLEEVEAIPEPDTEDTDVYEPDDLAKRGDRKPSQNRSPQNSRNDDWDSRRNLDDEDWE